jgi:hypothetical protein
MKAVRLFYDKAVWPDGSIIEMVIWQLPTPVPPATHSLKYRLRYGRDGQRIVAYDNERGKGDHRHFAGRESPYRFVNIDTLVADFLADVNRAKGQS